jgi:hypothetical protein
MAISSKHQRLCIRGNIFQEFDEFETALVADTQVGYEYIKLADSDDGFGPRNRCRNSNIQPAIFKGLAKSMREKIKSKGSPSAASG